jgi:hypothetical protein
MEKETREKESDSLKDDESSVPALIQAFASKLGEETHNQFTCYIYRIVTDPETGRRKKPFVKKYVGIEPDPAEIAERHRAGTYLVQFIWYVKGKQQSKAYSLDVDDEAFPPLPKTPAGALVPYNPGMSENMTLQLSMMHEISEIMKAAYSNNGGGSMRGTVQQDPLDMFSGLMETMEGSFSRAMAIQSKIMERVFTKNMEKVYGLNGEEIAGGSAPVGTMEETGIIGKYAPIVREVVDGIKTVIGFFGDVPPDVIKKVQSDGRFKELMKDQKALIVIGQALRREFGDQKAAEIMNSFGVRMIIKPTPEIARTPEIGGKRVQGTAGRAGTPGKVSSGPSGKAAAKGQGKVLK